MQPGEASAITLCQPARGDLRRPFSGSSSQCFFGFDSELVIDGNPKLLLAAQINQMCSTFIYRGCKQRFREAVNDRIGIEPSV
jgi:hypothetical protein